MLLVKWEMAARARNWASAMAIAKALIVTLPDEAVGWIYHGFAEQQMGLVAEARQTLLAAARKFPNDCRIAYNLACYAAQLGDIAGAWNWLDRALEIGDAAVIQSRAAEEPSLKPLWQQCSSEDAKIQDKKTEAPSQG
jgi:tetratricopeptide (TPR) repeat protein